MTTTLEQKSPIDREAISKTEIKLLLDCSRTLLTPSISDRINFLVRQDIDWQYLISFAAKHGLTPLLFNSLNKTCPEAVPKDIFYYLRTYFEANARRNLFVTAQLLKFLEIFRANDLDAIPFKGATLTAVAYGNMALRQFSDLDILVRKEHAKKATEILFTLGFNPPDKIAEAINKPYFQNSYFLESMEYQGSYDLYNPQTKIAFEMHWSLTTKEFSFSPKFQYLWTNTEAVTFAGQQIPQFSREILLIYLCVHASKPRHIWQELKWVCDISQLIQASPDLDWKKVNKLAKNWGCDRVLNIGLLLANNLLELELPEDILLKINRDRAAKRLVKQIIENISSNKKFVDLEERLFVVRSRERLPDQINSLFRLIFAPTAKEWNYFALPNSISFLYYFIRPYRLLREYFISKRTRANNP